MRVLLAHPDRDLDLEAEPPANADALTRDLGLDILFEAMGGEDRFLVDVARVSVLQSLDDPDVIRYRQRVLTDCLARPAMVRELYALAVEAIEGERRVWGYTPRFASSLLHRSVTVLELFADLLRRLRDLAAEHRPGMHSEGFARLLDKLASELDDAYLRSVEDHLRRLRFRDGVVVTAELGPGNRSTGYVLRRRVSQRGWRERIGLSRGDNFVYQIPERDEAEAQALAELRGNGIALAADALARSTDHILGFFRQLRAELGFYVGCLNLHTRLTGGGEPVCLPEPLAAGTRTLSATGLYDPCLSLRLDGRAVGNDLDADGRALIVVTGANRGGKSTFLRSLGVAHLMMQAGMFVPAVAFRAEVRRGLFTHFRREEDVHLQSGRLDEELRRMSAIVDRVGPHGLVLLNESFASTNEREGSEIARQIIRALVESGVGVCYVTHMFDLAGGFYAEHRPDALFLRAERLPDGRRTFRLVESEPLPTSHGQDIYRRILADGTAPPEAAPGEVA